MLILVLAACGSPSASTTGGAPAPLPVLPPRPLAQVFVLEASGAAPEDTVVTITPGAARVIVLRRSAPDFGLFATLDLRPGRDTAVAARTGPTTDVMLQPTPGLYSLTLAFQGAVADSATITFSYGTHFVAPAGARERYGSNLAFEKALAIGRVGDDGVVTFLPTTRPGSDILRAPLSGPGRYLVAAPR
jgi:hypothetical protein